MKGKPFAVYHDAFQYFEHRYGLKAVGSIFIAQDIAPGAKRLTELRKQIAKLNAVCIFSEPQADPRMLQANAEAGPRAPAYWTPRAWRSNQAPTSTSS